MPHIPRRNGPARQMRQARTAAPPSVPPSPAAVAAGNAGAADLRVPESGRARLLRARSEHDPEKWTPVFRKDHAPAKIYGMIRKSGYRFSEKIMLQQRSTA
jgi:hypothetical protein